MRPTAPCQPATHALLAHRRCHEAVRTFDPAGYRWPRTIPARFRTGLVSHNDVHPANLVFRDGRAVALIDFDLAGPGSAAWDFAAAARTWVPLHEEQDIHDDRRGRTIERFRVFLHACELTRPGRPGPPLVAAPPLRSPRRGTLTGC